MQGLTVGWTHVVIPEMTGALIPGVGMNGILIPGIKLLTTGLGNLGMNFVNGGIILLVTGSSPRVGSIKS